jgi:hypothetical protein
VASTASDSTIDAENASPRRTTERIPEDLKIAHQKLWAADYTPLIQRMTEDGNKPDDESADPANSLPLRQSQSTPALPQAPKPNQGFFAGVGRMAGNVTRVAAKLMPAGRAAARWNEKSINGPDTLT